MTHACPITFSLERGNTFIRCELPPTVKISENALGTCLRAARPVRAGETIYHGYMKLAEAKDYDEKYSLIVRDTHTQRETVFSVTRDVHNVPFGTHHHVYTFCSFTNHCCEGSSIARNWVIHDDGIAEHDVVALRDLAVDDEINCDYSTFYYDCSSLQRDAPFCLCGTARCRGKIMGFAQLSVQEQLETLPDIFPPLMTMFLRDHNALHLGDLAVPAHWRYESTHAKRDLCFVAEKDFSAEEVLADVSLPFVPARMENVCFRMNEHYFLHPTFALPGPACVEEKDRTRVCVPLMHFLANNNDEVNCVVTVRENRAVVKAIKRIVAGEVLRARTDICFK